MNTPRLSQRFIGARRELISVGTALLLCLGVTAVHAQRPSGGRALLAPEKIEAAWTLQANGIAKELGLSPELTAKVVDAYKASRKSHQETAGKALSTGEAGAGQFKALQGLNEAEKAKLKTALAAFLTPDQVDKAIVPLGTFNRQWDRFVDVLAGLNLAEDKKDKGLSVLAAYAVETSGARDKAAASGDMQALRTSAQEAKAKLDKAIAEVLDADQLEKWTAGTTFRGRQVERRDRDHAEAPATGQAGAPSGGQAPK